MKQNSITCLTRSLRLPSLILIAAVACAWLPWESQAQVNSGSTGADGAFNPTANIVINMADHPSGIYHYTSVNIPANVIVKFVPNTNNTPVVWLVQSNCTINGWIDISGADGSIPLGGAGGPGGFAGGNGGVGLFPAGTGLGPGGGQATLTNGSFGHIGGHASFATLGASSGPAGYSGYSQCQPGSLYGNDLLVPLIGGSGGGGSSFAWTNAGLCTDGKGGGGGGGGALLLAASGRISLNGSIRSWGGITQILSPYRAGEGAGGGGSGGAVRLVASMIEGGGTIDCGTRHGAILTTSSGGYCNGPAVGPAGVGRIRLDTLSNRFTGSSAGNLTAGFQPIIIPPPNQDVRLSIQSVGDVTVATNPSGLLTSPDVVIPGQQGNPVPVVVACANIPLNTQIIVDVKPANGAAVQAIGLNSTGTQASSTATVLVTMPRGGGTIQAKAVSGIAGLLGASANDGQKFRSYAQTGLTADGETFTAMEVITTVGGTSQVAYLSESGKRYPWSNR